MLKHNADCYIRYDLIAKNDYPENWPAIAIAVKDEMGWKCERCGHPHEPYTGYTLTVHHLDGNKANCERWNLAALCQRCHLRIQNMVFLPQFFMLEISAWFRPHVQGYYESIGFKVSWEGGIICLRS